MIAYHYLSATSSEKITKCQRTFDHTVKAIQLHAAASSPLANVNTFYD